MTNFMIKLIVLQWFHPMVLGLADQSENNNYLQMTEDNFSEILSKTENDE